MKASNKILIGAALLAMGSSAAYAAVVTVGGVQTSNSAVNGDSATGGVVVTATVQPTLSMTISTGGLSLGDLDTTGKTASLDIEVGTNAKDGVTVTAASANSGLASATANHTISDASDYVGEGYTFASTLGDNDSQVVNTQGALTVVEVTDTVAKTVYTNNKPENVDGTADVTFTVGAKIDAATPAAADYTDTLTFTVTGAY